MKQLIGSPCSDLPGPAALLSHAARSRIEPRDDLRGFGGLHGGWTLARLVAAMSSEVPELTLRSVTGRFHRAIDQPTDVTLGAWSRGRSVVMGSASAVTTRGVAADAVAIFGRSQSSAAAGVAPTAPSAPPPESCEPFAIPTEFVPFTQHLEIRPIGPNRPFTGGHEPTLTAWVRLVEDDRAPDVLRFVVIADALAPSWTAVLDALVPVPTLELTIRPGDGLGRARSPWVLLHASTRRVTSGWVEEIIDGWGADGEHLGSAHQLRLVLGSADRAPSGEGPHGRGTLT